MNDNMIPDTLDTLHGAKAIAEFLYGDTSKRAQVYNGIQNSNLPVFRIGATICARKSSLVKWIEAQERINMSG